MNNSAEFYSDVISDARDVREQAKESIKESITPRLRKMIADDIKASEESDDDEEEMTPEDEIELDLDLDLDDDEPEEDEGDLDEYFFNENESNMRENRRRHFDKDVSREYSERGPRHTGPEMLDIEYEDGHMETDFDVHEDEAVDVDALLSEYGVTDVEREPRYDSAEISTPYNMRAQEREQASDDMGDFDPRQGRGTRTRSYDAEMPPINERRRNRRSRRSRRLAEDEQLGKYKQAIKILKSRLNETNLMNSKLFYSNKLTTQFGLSEGEYEKAMNMLEEANTINEAKKVYKELSERLSESGNSETISQRERDAQRINEGLNKRRSGQSSEQNDEGVGDVTRTQELAGIRKSNY